MNSRTLKSIAYILGFVMFLAATPLKAQAAGQYNAQAALNFASQNCVDQPGDDNLCAWFVSECIQRGGCNAYSRNCVQLSIQLLTSGMVESFDMAVNSNGTITSANYRNLVPGDVVMFYCAGCDTTKNKPYIHAVLCNGNLSNGLMKAYSRTGASDGNRVYYYNRNCYSCGTPITRAVAFHFTDSGEYVDRGYNPCDAVKFASQYWRNYEAGPTLVSACLNAGGVAPSSSSIMTLKSQLDASNLGTNVDVEVLEDGSIKLRDYIDRVSIGDPVFYYCATNPSRTYIRMAIVAGMDEDGFLLAHTVPSGAGSQGCGATEKIKYTNCGLCQAKITKATIYHMNVSENFHRWDSRVVIREATEEAEGVVAIICSECGGRMTYLTPMLEPEEPEEPEALLGDLDSSGVVDIADMEMLAKYIAQVSSLSDAQLALADVNEDGKIDSADITAMNCQTI